MGVKVFLTSTLMGLALTGSSYATEICSGSAQFKSFPGTNTRPDIKYQFDFQLQDNDTLTGIRVTKDGKSISTTGKKLPGSSVLLTGANKESYNFGLASKQLISLNYKSTSNNSVTLYPVKNSALNCVTEQPRTLILDQSSLPLQAPVRITFSPNSSEATLSEIRAHNKGSSPLKSLLITSRKISHSRTKKGSSTEDRFFGNFEIPLGGSSVNSKVTFAAKHIDGAAPQASITISDPTGSLRIYTVDLSASRAQP